MSELTHHHLGDKTKQKSEVKMETAPLINAPSMLMMEEDFGMHLTRLRGTVSKDVDLEF